MTQLNKAALKAGQFRILVCRPDRLGDVILATPTLEAIHQQFPDCQLTLMVKPNVVPILRGLPSIQNFLIYQPEGRHAGIRGFFRLVSAIRRMRFHFAVILQTQWKVGLAVFLARVPERIGPWSKLHSYVFYNRGLRQRRSHVEMHETDYNLQLLQKLGVQTGTGRSLPTQVYLEEAVLERAGQWLKGQGWKEDSPLIQIHPGMGGSALNWPDTHYLELMQLLLQEGMQILVTGGPLEKELLNQFEMNLLKGSENKESKNGTVIFYRAGEKESVAFLGALSSYCQVVIAPSTGPLHLAVALRKPVVTFYPPIRVQSALRWGPYQAEEVGASVLVPEVYCGQDRKCLGSLCNYYPCMKGLTVKQVLKEVHLQLGRSTLGKSP